MKRTKPYSPVEAAAKLKISRSAIHEAIKEGRLKATRKQRVIYFYEIAPADLDAYRVSSKYQELGKKK